MSQVAEPTSEGFTREDLMSWREQHPLDRLELIDGLIWASEEFTEEHLEQWREQHPLCRVEKVDGCLVVTPSPRPAHQGIVMRLGALVSSQAPAGLVVLPAPLDVRLPPPVVPPIGRPSSTLQPDLLVTSAEQELRDRLNEIPLLAVEVLSPTTRGYDLGTKRARYEEAGVLAHWVVDPRAATITVLELQDGAYVEVAAAGAGERLVTDRPFPLTLDIDQVLRPDA